MNLIELEDILRDQKAELDLLRQDALISRPEEDLIDLRSRQAQVVIGVRRSGKSTLCFNALEKAGVNYAYVNFDDERLAKCRTEHLDLVLEALYRIYDKFEHLFLDEIQNVDGWPLFVNRLLRQRIHMLITGSNAKLLSTDLATHLTGRHHKIELLPFSFREWCTAKGVNFDSMTTRNRGLLGREFNEYLHIGGFPELVYELGNATYISTLFDNIINQDIKNRFNVRNVGELMKMANHILNETPDCFTQDGLMDISGIKSDHTIMKYLSYLQQTYLISQVKKYSRKSRQRSTNEKYYAIDVAFMDKRENAFAGDNLGWRLETIVYLELRRRYAAHGYDIYYHKEKSCETDFIVCNGNRTICIYQVSYDISKERTRQREIRGCLAGAKLTQCDNLYIITDHQRENITVDNKTIKVIPAYEWLLNASIDN
ncbi:MAG: ATP-binding protein [Muribaculaceae bacterium]|nr:ATP-binding protein [Muribaculaceae bacterium]